MKRLNRLIANFNDRARKDPKIGPIACVVTDLAGGIRCAGSKRMVDAISVDRDVLFGNRRVDEDDQSTPLTKLLLTKRAADEIREDDGKNVTTDQLRSLVCAMVHGIKRSDLKAHSK